MRELLWEQLRGEFDLLVIGGGATGAGVALSAARRGLRVALVERHDFSEGTSSRSTKLIHGGIRYLELCFRSGDLRHLRLVAEALQERHWLLHWAPHLIHGLWLVTPCRNLPERCYYSAGVQLYDLLAGKARLHRPRYLSAEALAVWLAGLQAPAGGVAFPDGQFDDARFNWELIRTAVAQGALAVNHVEVVALEQRHGRVCGAVVRDRLSGETRSLAARLVVNAAGPFADAIRRLADPHAEPILQTSAGAHLVLRATPAGVEDVSSAALPVPRCGLLIPHTEDRRVVFLLPWYGHWLLGTTDVAVPPSDYPTVSPAEVEYLLRQVRPYVANVDSMTITARWSGIRPLVRSQQSNTAQTVREHCIEELRGLVTLVGGKWTTFRVMAEELLDWLHSRGWRWRRASTWPPPFSATPLTTSSAKLQSTPHSSPGSLSNSQFREATDEDVRRHLRQYGRQAATVLELSRDFPGRLLEGWPYLRAEVVFATRYEMARMPLDFLARRIRLAFLDTNATLRALPEVVRLMAKELGWSAPQAETMQSQARQRLQAGV